MAYSPGATDAFMSGVAHPVNPGRQNLGSVTLGGSLQADSDRWDGLTPHGVLRTAQSIGTPADTDATIEWGQESVGNTDDAATARQSMHRMLMQQAAHVGSDDNIA